MNMQTIFTRDLDTENMEPTAIETVKEMISIVQQDVDLFESREDYEKLATGSEAILFRKGNIVIKIGIDIDAYRKQGFQGRVMTPYVKEILDGKFMHGFESKWSMPYLYAFGDEWVIMSLIDGTPLSDFTDEDYRTYYDMAAEQYATIFEDQGILLTDLHDDNIFVDRDGQVVFIDFGSFEHYTEDAWQEKFDELEELGEEGFFDTYRASVEFN